MVLFYVGLAKMDSIGVLCLIYKQQYDHLQAKIFKNRRFHGSNERQSDYCCSIFHDVFALCLAYTYDVCLGMICSMVDILIKLKENSLQSHDSIAISLRSTCGIGDFSRFLVARRRTTACKRGIRFVKKSTSLQHRPRQTISLKLRQLQGRTHILLLANEALVAIRSKERVFAAGTSYDEHCYRYIPIAYGKYLKEDWLTNSKAHKSVQTFGTLSTKQAPKLF